jgi:hypothetical protein
MAKFRQFIVEPATKKLAAKARFRHRTTQQDLIVVSADYTHPCPACGKPTPLDLRQTDNGVIYDQPWCGPCRNKKQCGVYYSTEGPTLRLALADADAGKGVLMSVDEAERAIVTGRWPDSSE